MPRSIDHLVLAVPDLAAAVALYRAIGFTVGSRNLHPWETENAVVALDGAYLELIGLAPGYRAPESGDPAAPFADLVASAVARGGGLAAMALGSSDADADAAAFRTAGLGTGRRLDFAREAVAHDGTRRVLRFGLAFADVPGLPDAGLFTCRHHQPFGDAAMRRHANGAIRLDAAWLAVDAPHRHAPSLAAILGAAPGRPAERPGFATPTGRLDLLTLSGATARTGAAAMAGRFAGFGIVVDALAPLRAFLTGAGVPHADTDGILVVPPTASFGAALAFVPAACDAKP